MFTRIRTTIAAFKKPAPDEIAATPPDAAGEIQRHHEDSQWIHDLDGVEPLPRNPIVVAIEVVIATVGIVYLFNPAVKLLLSPSEKVHAILMVLGTFAVISLLSFVEGHLKERFSLRFLDPYFGRRIAKTREAFRD